MKAWRTYGGTVRLEEVPDPEPGPDELLVHVEVCGVCRTDLHVVDGDLPVHRAHVVPGHQVVGRVVATGSAVTGTVGVGARVGVAWLAIFDRPTVAAKNGIVPPTTRPTKPRRLRVACAARAAADGVPRASDRPRAMPTVPASRATK